MVEEALTMYSVHCTLLGTSDAVVATPKRPVSTAALPSLPGPLSFLDRLFSPLGRIEETMENHISTL